MEISGHRRHRLLLEMAASLPPSHGDRTGDFHNNIETNIDSNMVIILAVLLCAIICALGLNSMIRFALRCGHRFSQTEEATSRLAATAGSFKKSSLIGQFPEVTYRPGLHILVTDCLICLGELADGEKIRVLPKCNHAFHVKCIDKWLWSHISCPLCRRSLLDESTSRSTDAEAVNVTAVQLSVNHN